MTPEQFCWWLKGLSEVADMDSLPSYAAKQVLEKLDKVLSKPLLFGSEGACGRDGQMQIKGNSSLQAKDPQTQILPHIQPKETNPGRE